MRAVVVSHLYADPANRAKLKALAGLGVNLTVAVPDQRGSKGGKSQVPGRIEDGLRVVPIGVRGNADDPARLEWNRKALRDLLANPRPDLLHVEEEPWSRAAAVGLRWAKKFGIPSVVSTTQSLPRRYTIGERFRRGRSLRLASGVIGTNNLAVKLATKHRPTMPQLALPQLGVTPPAEAPRVPHPGLAIGFLGRLTPERGLDLLFRACVSLAGKWTLSVIGTGPSQEELEQLAQRLGIAARISWLGALPRKVLDEIWPRLDCVVVPSRSTETWVMTEGRAALDAMAHGLAVIGTDSGALPELVGDAGRIVPEEDVQGLAAVLQQLYADRAECERLGSAGRRRIVEEFSDAALARKTLSFWRTLTTATA
jgi:glycosyltransferase involved in cell wall biosynthesis